MSECCEKSRKKPRTAGEKRSLLVRINRITGQLNGVKKMIEEDRYCEDVLIQLSAADSALRSLAAIVLEDHLNTCIAESIKDGNVEVVDELMKLFRSFR